MEAFKINVEITAADNQLLVIPTWKEELARTEYELILDGVTLSTIFMNDDGNWHQLQGNLDEELIYQIGTAIEDYDD